MSILIVMRFIERTILFFFPLLSLKRTKWETIWLQQEKEAFLSGIRVFFSLAAAVYLLHYYTVDRFEGLAPSTLWMTYRFSMTGISLACLAFYMFPKCYGIRHYKLPMMVAGAIFCYFQTRTIIWYAEVPYLYSFAFVLICAVVFRATIFSSLVYGALLLALIFPSLIDAGQSPSMMFSASIVTLVFIVYMKSKSVADINLFIANQTNLDSQKKIIEINLEFTNQIKSFLPTEISNRLIYFVQEQRMSVLQAIHEVLRPRQAKIACLFSDIRGFTKASADLNGFVSKSLLPNIKASTVAAERFKGIPRKIGDLLFCYYDGEDFDENLRNVFRTAVELSNVNHELNRRVPEDFQIKRYILISGGDAIVGNLSGYDSTIEISAIGTPVNFLARIDELTKNEVLRERLVGGDIIFTPNLVEDLNRIFPGLSYSAILISGMDLKIRDFADVQELYLLPLTKRNFHIITKDSDLSPQHDTEEAA